VTEEEAVCERLLSTAGVTALVGTRVYQLKLPQRPTLPAIRVQLINSTEPYHLRGGSAWHQVLIQTDAVAEESAGDPYATAVAIADAIHLSLSGQRFDLGSPVTLEITGMFRQSRVPMYESAELRQVRIMQDYLVWSHQVS
jgi:hypothetical protein